MILRIVGTVLFFGAFFYFVPFNLFVATLASCPWQGIVIPFLLLPVFLYFRTSKWFMLTRQIAPGQRYLSTLRSYLFGMALGLVTPGRLGEVTRIKGSGLPPSTGAALFILEKYIEVLTLATLCVLGLFVHGALHFPIFLMLCFVIFFCLTGWRYLFRGIQHVFASKYKALGCKFEERFSIICHDIPKIKILRSYFFNILTMLVYCLQLYIVLVSLRGETAPEVIALFPVVILSNLAPVTVGGFGVRESLAAVLLSPKYASSDQAASAFFLVAGINLVLTGVAGFLLQYLPESKSTSRTNTA